MQSQEHEWGGEAVGGGGLEAVEGPLPPPLYGHTGDRVKAVEGPLGCAESPCICVLQYVAALDPSDGTRHVHLIEAVFQQCPSG
jgi:hypothetical protein